MHPQAPNKQKRRRGESFSPWQSFADLALGLMAVFALVLVMMLWTQGQQNDVLAAETSTLQARTRELESEKSKLEQAALTLELSKRELERQRSAFALELLEIFVHTRAVVDAQDGAEAWIRDLFNDGQCPLVMAEDGSLRRADHANKNTAAADLYRPGEARMNAEGERALRQCHDTFLRLAYCLSPDAESLGSARAKVCYGVPDISGVNDTTRAQLQQLRQGLESLVLQGNTDKTSIAGISVEPIRSQGDRLKMDPLTDSFVQNAYLGSERARQALGHLLHGLQTSNADDNDALQVMMARVRIESTSFGRYQVGPEPWRAGDCAKHSDDCAEARNLSLSVRWKKQELRAPYEEILEKVCAMMNQPDSALSQGVIASLSRPELLSQLRVTSAEWQALLTSGEATTDDMKTLLGCKAAP